MQLVYCALQVVNVFTLMFRRAEVNFRAAPLMKSFVQFVVRIFNFLRTIFYNSELESDCVACFIFIET